MSREDYRPHTAKRLSRYSLKKTYDHYQCTRCHTHGLSVDGGPIDWKGGAVCEFD